MTFEQFVIDTHAKQYIGCKDNMVDDYDGWIENLDHEDYLIMGEKYALVKGQEIIKRIEKGLKNECLQRT